MSLTNLIPLSLHLIDMIDDLLGLQGLDNEEISLYVTIELCYVTQTIGNRDEANNQISHGSVGMIALAALLSSSSDQHLGDLCLIIYTLLPSLTNW